MYKARCYKADGAEGGEQNLPDWLFDGVVNEPVLHQVVKAYLANQRQGTASAKSRGQVAGGSRKPWRQKGTGRARQGTIRAAQWAGGGRAFPPIPHSWRQQIPKKVRALARRSAFNWRAQGERVLLIDGLDFETPKTGRLVSLLSAIGAEGKVLLLTDGPKENIHRSASNLHDVDDLSPESVLDAAPDGPVDLPPGIGLDEAVLRLERLARSHVPLDGARDAVCVHDDGQRRGTVSSAILAVDTEGRPARFLAADGAPCRASFQPVPLPGSTASP